MFWEDQSRLIQGKTVCKDGGEKKLQSNSAIWNTRCNLSLLNRMVFHSFILICLNKRFDLPSSRYINPILFPLSDRYNRVRLYLNEKM